MAQVAQLLDKAYDTTRYSEAIIREQAKINDASLTPSAELLSIIKQQCLSQFALDKAKQYQEQAETRDYQFYNQAFFDDSVHASHQAQADIEASDKLNFDDFLSDYFA
jgi:glutamate--cysteine ligase